MSSYIVLARRWRPRNFSALIGQQHVVQALQNALSSGRVPHAFLFSGTRGVGKTTLARILAMRLNCQESQTAEPCGECASCQEVIVGAHPDVMEIDAASRTKVEQMRELLELAPYAPAASPFKVFILDEIHMLSTQSFNALLKTLEEPPAHVKFIFATTEPRKIPATILSRCQRHDLKRVTPATLIKHLEEILVKEQIPWDATALQAVAQAADGSVRDGLSLLDQVIAHGDGAVRYEAVHSLLGLTDRDAAVRLLDHLLTGQGPEVLHAVEQFHAGGVEPAALVRDLLELVHQRTRTQVTTLRPPKSPSLEHLQMIYQTLLKGEAEIKLADQPYQALEMLVLRAAYLKPIPDLDKLIASLGTGSMPPMTPITPVATVPPTLGGAGTGGGRFEAKVASVQANNTVVITSAPPSPAFTPAHQPEAFTPTHKPQTLTPAPQQPVAATDANTMTLWNQMLSMATEQVPDIARKIVGQVACLHFGKGADGHLADLSLRVANECFGTPDRMREHVVEMLKKLGLPPVKVTVEAASSAPRPETMLEQMERQAQEHRTRLEQEVLARPEVKHLVECFAARIVSVEPYDRA
ncbi:MAG: DNA polymerase III subunit gamma/tau [Magnetococcus sp. YQC-5]